LKIPRIGRRSVDQKEILISTTLGVVRDGASRFVAKLAVLVVAAGTTVMSFGCQGGTVAVHDRVPGPWHDGAIFKLRDSTNQTPCGTSEKEARYKTVDTFAKENR
jgi:hypothetical protein